jgi:hypothetical protein
MHTLMIIGPSLVQIVNMFLEIFQLNFCLNRSNLHIQQKIIKITIFMGKRPHYIKHLIGMKLPIKFQLILVKM